MKRILVLLTVVALLMAMMAMAAVPAFASSLYTCTGTISTGETITFYEVTPFQKHIFKQSGFTCTRDVRR